MVMNALDVVENAVQVVVYVVIEQKNAWIPDINPSLNVVIVLVKIINAIRKIV